MGRRAGSLRTVNKALRQLLDEHDGVIHRDNAVARMPSEVVDHAVRSGRLRRLYPLVYAERFVQLDQATVVRAALAYASGVAALSHLSALAAWRLPAPSDGPIHLMTGLECRLRGARGLRIHRRIDFMLEPPEVLTRDGQPVTRIEQSIVDSWPLLDGDARRAPAIAAVSQRLTTPRRLADALEAAPRLGGRRLLARLIAQLHAGCHSPLELWGYDHVFQGPDLASLRRQVPVQLGPRTTYLDLFDDETKVNFELDGTKYHAGLVDRERDLRRDAALAAYGIMVVRFTHERLLREPAAVRQQARAIIAARRGSTAA